MMLNTTRFGQVDFDPASTITFPRGLPGFEQCTRWKMFHEEDEQGQPRAGIVLLLQSVDNPDAVLPVADPAVFGFHYEFVLSDSELAEIKLEDPDDLAVLVVMNEKNNVSAGNSVQVQNMFANISAPILINTRSQLAMQRVFLGPEAKVAYRPR
jgi:flagellar assembly factor FliW